MEHSETKKWYTCDVCNGPCEHSHLGGSIDYVSGYAPIDPVGVRVTFYGFGFLNAHIHICRACQHRACAHALEQLRTSPVKPKESKP